MGVWCVGLGVGWCVGWGWAPCVSCGRSVRIFLSDAARRTDAAPYWRSSGKGCQCGAASVLPPRTLATAVRGGPAAKVADCSPPLLQVAVKLLISEPGESMGWGCGCGCGCGVWVGGWVGGCVGTRGVLPAGLPCGHIRTGLWERCLRQRCLQASWRACAAWYAPSAPTPAACAPAPPGPADFHGEVAELELPAEVARRLQKEAGVMCGLRHPHLVTFLGLCTMPPCILTGARARRSRRHALHTQRATPAKRRPHAWSFWAASICACAPRLLPAWPECAQCAQGSMAEPAPPRPTRRVLLARVAAHGAATRQPRSHPGSRT